ncbi:MarR family transcriptional regulator [Arthrobacter sp. ATA002]|uniref:MarR family winged helix-turn-helix transcriptional regulator n=1 Tax=Arthrobacter sp. ATA002 TaxID=2991715 RepID=UPI0022A7079B|nr:MarR family transcriptional regulator [Arthrobacter sp. ATA002]WAP51576.1 MarR family transcriptional regulator [Arthrobacter sp. ATA002]
MRVEHNDLRRNIVKGIRGMALDGQRVADTFAHREGLNATDMRALTLIMEAETRQEPLTAGRLSTLLGTSTGATTAVIDRLERIGHIHRNRGHADRRKVTLHFEPLAMKLAAAYFGPLGALTDDVMSRYSTEELETVLRFMGDMREAYAAHQEALASPRTTPGSVPEQHAP